MVLLLYIYTIYLYFYFDDRSQGLIMTQFNEVSFKLGTCSNTIDLRGMEQIATCREAEQYAAYLGYELFVWYNDIFNVDPESAKDISRATNRLLTE